MAASTALASRVANDLDKRGKIAALRDAIATDVALRDAMTRTIAGDRANIVQGASDVSNEKRGCELWEESKSEYEQRCLMQQKNRIAFRVRMQK